MTLRLEVPSAGELLREDPGAVAKVLWIYHLSMEQFMTIQY